MGWLYALIRSSALGKLIEFMIKAFKNAKADEHISNSHRDIRAAIKRVRDKQSQAQERPKDN